MQPFLAVATLVAALGVVAVNSETAYVLAPVQPRVLSSGWGWRPVRTVSLALPSISRGWGWGKQRPSGGISIGVYGGLRIGPKQQGWGGWQQPQKQHGWGWQQKQHGWGWQPQKQHGWGWQPPKQQGWGWKQQGWGWDDDDDEDDYRSTALALDDEPYGEAESSEEIYDDDASGSLESDENDDSAEADHIDLRDSIAYNPIYV